ncbi:TPA: LCP family protein [Bacillus thuringiensis]|uniref:LytR family transcriptional regulator n=3 Tax=Bacillus cereus group TaxID=86661 RepID=A0A9X6Q697_BACTU|nr:MULTISPECIES: LCP family protein [Bacillus cereus group]NIE91527.1 LytR family transcriptional regulator [Bacillus sp. Ab-1751]AGE81179.1 Transcriptional regulator, LytR [Bacillus thuringiensis serovar kurstaki str. HD73]AHZ54115.1 LytR family transcriptional regulator [Bacillus thuringiensis serovar kurstaki str. YBT-1520]AIE36505.1 LytR family transcriptional regulator [Bacillus thuringiensis serovar kurstaki str. HD-1]AIM29047.1 transcriptional regulator, LytR [Bacillus thuringiensis ser
MEERYYHLQNSRIKKKRRRKLFFFLIFAFLFGSIGVYVLNSYSSLMGMYSGFTREKSDLRNEDVEITKEPFTILIMGIEDYATDGQNGRTDSLMFATVNPKTKKVSLMSIPRDSRVPIVGKGKEDKINAAHAYGGEEMAIKTVEGFLKVPVDHYIKIDFQGFKGIVDAVGGVTVDVPFDFWERSDVDYYKKIQFKQGQQNLNGEEALAYVRMRKQDPNGDYGRAARQRQLLAAVAQKLNSTSTVFKIKDLTTVVGKYIKTDIPISDGLALYNKLSGFDPSTIQTLKLEGEDKKIGGIYYFLPDPISVETVRNEIEKELGEKAKNPTTKNNSNPDSNSSSNSNEQTKKATNQNKTPTDPPPSTNAHAEWIMRNQP